MFLRVTGLTSTPNTARNDTKDREFVAALISTGLVHKHVVHERIEAIRDERFGSQQRQMSLDALRGL